MMAADLAAVVEQCLSEQALQEEVSREAGLDFTKAVLAFAEVCLQAHDQPPCSRAPTLDAMC